MTDIGRMAHVVPARTQLPVSAYFDEALFAREQELIFKQSSLYVGHQKLVPEIGDWRTLAQENGGRVLVRNQQGAELISNVCRHRQALMLGGEAGDVTGHCNSHGSLKAVSYTHLTAWKVGLQPERLHANTGWQSGEKQPRREKKKSRHAGRLSFLARSPV